MITNDLMTGSYNTVVTVIIVLFPVLLGEFVILLFLQVHRETDLFLPTSGVHLP